MAYGAWCLSANIFLILQLQHTHQLETTTTTRSSSVENLNHVDLLAPQFESLKLLNLTHLNNVTKLVFEVRGRNLFSGLDVKATTIVEERGSVCDEQIEQQYEIDEIYAHEFQRAAYALTIPRDVYGDFYLCVPRKNELHDNALPPSVFKEGPYKWLHQGPNITLNVPKDYCTIYKGQPPRHRRQSDDETGLKAKGLRIQQAYKDFDLDEDGVPEVLANHEHEIRLFGSGFVPEMIVTFTAESDHYGSICEFPTTKGFPILAETYRSDTVEVKINLPPMQSGAKAYYICIKERNSSSFVHQGNETWLRISTYETPLPIWVTIIIIVLCLMFSSLFSGLNLGLMSMDQTELKILCNTGTSAEQKYARAIQPVRAHGNYLLCSILLGNVFVNSIFTILLDGLTSGWVAVIFSTIAIVLFGEITPQAICSRHGLWIGAKTIYITKFVMCITFPMSYPVSKFLDCILGEEISNVYNRERLKELVKVTTGANDLDKDEVNIISGALELRKKTVADVMTKIEDVFMLDYDSILDFETVSEIMKSGYSRVPVYEGTRQNIVTMLYIKDLAFVDPDDNTPLKTLCQFYQNPCNFVFEDVTLDVMFRIFKEGNKGHMAFVHRVNNEGEGDPFYETMGLITLEDVIEELIQAEIMDETDVFTDNRTKRRRNADRRQDFSVFAEKRGETYKIRISPQLTLAAFQFLSTAVEQFLPSVISETILKRLLKQDIIYHIKKNKEWRTDPHNLIYTQGKASDYFVLILEGRVEVTIGKENLTFEGGPFTYFGTQALIQNIGVVESPSVAASTLGSLESLNLDAMLRHTFQPDYSVRASSEVIYLKIKRSLYLAAKRATLMERSQRDNTQTKEQFDEEVDKILHFLEDEDTESAGRGTPRKRSSKNLHQSTDLGNASKPILYANSPPQPVSPKEVQNGMMLTSPSQDDSREEDEQVSLLSKKS